MAQGADLTWLEIIYGVPKGQRGPASQSCIDGGVHISGAGLLFSLHHLILLYPNI